MNVCLFVCVRIQKTEFYSSYPVYHSVYETFEIVEKFYDPSFQRLRAVAQVRGGLIFRLADSQVLPLDVNEYAAALGKYAHSISQVAQRHPAEMTKYQVSFGEMTLFLALPTFPRRTSCSTLLCFPVCSDALFSAVENFTLASRGFHERLLTLNRAE